METDTQVAVHLKRITLYTSFHLYLCPLEELNPYRPDSTPYELLYNSWINLFSFRELFSPFICFFLPCRWTIGQGWTGSPHWFIFWWVFHGVVLHQLYTFQICCEQCLVSISCIMKKGVSMPCLKGVIVFLFYWKWFKNVHLADIT